MTSLAPLSHRDENSMMPLARIDTQDVEYVIPLREYLEANGCRVFVNQQDAFPVVYSIVAGDSDYVKSIFAGQKNVPVRQLGIIIGSAEMDASFQKFRDAKIMYVDAVYLSAKDVLEIFSFFFAGIENVYDKRRTLHEPQAPIDALENEAVNKEKLSVDDAYEKVKEKSRHANTQSAELLTVNDTNRIGSIMSEIFAEPTKSSTEKFTKKVRKTFKNIRCNGISFLLILCVLLAPLFWYGGSLFITTVSFVISGNQLLSGSPSRAFQFSSTGTYWLRQSKASFSIVKIPFVLAHAYTFTRNNERILSLYTDVSDMFSDLQNISAQTKQLTMLMKGGSSEGAGVSPALVFDHLRRTTEETHNRLGLAEAQLQILLRDKAFPFVFPVVIKKANTVLQTFQSVRSMLTYVNTALLLYPRIAGFTEPKTYLVLLQNSNELRPTGGFIGSVGIAKFEDGMLSDFAIQDVYALDGQLKGHVDPPKPIRELLRQEHWYLRDSNWSPDFKISGQQAAWFYEKETGMKVDGVMSINVPFVVDVLKAIGPVQLPDYNDRITADNFFGKSFYYTQHDFFPGSTQKKDFLGSLFRAIVSKILTDADAATLNLFTAFSSGIAKRDIAFMFENKELQSIVEHFGWAGRIFADAGCSGLDSQFCLYDPVAVNETNVSVSKINYFITRSGTREIAIAPDGAVSETIHMYIRNTVNTSADATTPGIGGAYRGYIRFILPEDSIVNDVRVDNQKVVSRDPEDTVIIDVPYIEKSDGPDGTSVIGVAFAVAPGVTNDLTITYVRGKRIVFGKAGGVLDAVWYKHPGVNSIDLVTTIRYPLYWVAKNMPVQAFVPVGSELSNLSKGMIPFVAKKGELEYNTQVRTDEMIRVKFTP